MARHLDGIRFVCADTRNVVVRTHFPATAECHQAISERPNYRFIPELNIKGLEPEWVANKIGLSLNWLDVEQQVPDDIPTVQILLGGHKIGDLKRSGDDYYCSRFPQHHSPNAYGVALLMVHPDYLYGIPDEIIAERQAMPDYV
jgi:hypothetical protein